MPTNPTPVSALPAAPDPNNRATFNTLAYPWSAALPNFGTQLNAIGAASFTNATEAAASATMASNAANLAGAVLWVSGTTYGVGDAVTSPANLATYRRKIAGAGTTDPSLDATNWTFVTNLPDQTSQSGKVLSTDGTNASWQLPFASQTGNANRFLTTNGTTTSWGVADVSPIGTIVYAPTAPTSGTWLKCDGSSYLQATYPALYSQLGRQYTTIAPRFTSSATGVRCDDFSVIGSTFMVSNDTTFRYSTNLTSWTTVATISMTSGCTISVCGSRVVVFVWGVNRLYFSDDQCLNWTTVAATGFSPSSHVSLVNGRYYCNASGSSPAPVMTSARVSLPIRI
jgi:hypothetical protein